MKKYVPLFLISGLIIISLLSSCDEGTLPPDFSEFLEFSVDETSFTDNAEYDFGLSAAEGSGKTSSLTITNTSDITINVTSLDLSDTVNYSFTSPELPFTAESGQSTAITLTYHPQSSGSHTAAISINIDGIAETFTLKLIGEGNYAPTVKFGIQVVGAGIAAANGFYARDGFRIEDTMNRPMYTKMGTENYYSYIYPWDGAIWCIDDTQTAGGNNPEPKYNLTSYPMIVPGASGWSTETGTAPAPTIIRYDITGTSAYYNEVLTANYLFYDAEDDTEAASGTSYQWYRSYAEKGTYSSITGATSKTYTLPNDTGYFLKVEITPAASAGITIGTPVMSSATIQINSIPEG